jgi:hypothetical protein
MRDPVVLGMKEDERSGARRDRERDQELRWRAAPDESRLDTAARMLLATCPAPPDYSLRAGRLPTKS